MHDTGNPSVGRDPQDAGRADLEAGAVVSMRVVRDAAIQAARPHDQADGAAGDYAVQVGASGRRALRLGSLEKADISAGALQRRLMTH